MSENPQKKLKLTFTRNDGTTNVQTFTVNNGFSNYYKWSQLAANKGKTEEDYIKTLIGDTGASVTDVKIEVVDV